MGGGGGGYMTTSICDSIFCDYPFTTKTFSQPPLLRPLFIKIPATPNQLHETSRHMQDTLNTIPIRFPSKAKLPKTVFLLVVFPNRHETICPIVTIYIRTLLAWAKCFLATYGEYPGLYDLLDTPRSVFLAAQLHLRDCNFIGLSYPNLEAPYPPK